MRCHFDLVDAHQLAITHIFPCSINGLLASLKGVSFCAEPFEGTPFRVILSGSNIDRGRNYNCPCGWSKMWVIARLTRPLLTTKGPRWLDVDEAHTLARDAIQEAIQEGALTIADYPGWRLEARDASGAILFTIRL